MLDTTMYNIAQLFLMPILFIILLMFMYAFFALGAFIFEALSRRKHTLDVQKTQGAYSLVRLYQKNKNVSIEKLELHAHKKLEMLRSVSRVAPMFGLIGTLIPLGPALKALSHGNIQGMSEGFVIAFSAVTLGLIAASITYWIANIKKRWYADELHAIELKRANHVA